MLDAYLQNTSIEITSTTTKPFELLELNIVGTLPEAGFQKLKYILTLQDDLMKFSISFGIPRMIFTDQGTCFTSEMFKRVTEIFKIKLF